MKFFTITISYCTLFPALIFSQESMELDVKTIMQDPKTWVGSAPGNPFWSEDGKWIYFD